MTAPTAPAGRGDDGTRTPLGRLLAAFSPRPVAGEGELASGQPVPTVRPRPERPEAAGGGRVGGPDAGLCHPPAQGSELDDDATRTALTSSDSP